MKHIRLLLSILSIILIITATNLNVFAVNSGFVTNPYPEENKNRFIENINLSLLKEEPEKKPIECFDVNKDGLIAIATCITRDKYVCVYSSDGDFLYGYSLSAYGSIGLEWNGSSLNIYFVRSDIIVNVDKNGDVLDIAQVENTSENNSYINHFINYPKRTIGNVKYAIKNDMGILNLLATSYSQLVMIDAEGKETILYDVASSQIASILTVTFCVLVFLALSFYLGLRRWKEYKNRTQKSNNT